MRHKEEQYDAVVAQAKQWRKKQQILQVSGGGCVDATNTAKQAANTTQLSNKLAVKDRLEEVLYSRLMISDNDADNLSNKICGQGKRLGRKRRGYGIN